MIELTSYFEVLKANKLTQSQILFMLLINEGRYDLLDDYHKLYPTGDSFIIGIDLTNDLIKKNFISAVFKDNNEDTNIVVDFELLPKFYSAFNIPKKPIKEPDKPPTFLKKLCKKFGRLKINT